MSAFRPAGHDPVNAFDVDGVYVFKHFFDENQVFGRLKQYYNGKESRFEVPANDFQEVRDLLDNYGYGLVDVGAIDEFVVVVEQYTDHPRDIFKESVLQRTVDRHNCFLLRD